MNTVNKTAQSDFSKCPLKALSIGFQNQCRHTVFMLDITCSLKSWTKEKCRSLLHVVLTPRRFVVLAQDMKHKRLSLQAKCYLKRCFLSVHKPINVTINRKMLLRTSTPLHKEIFKSEQCQFVQVHDNNTYNCIY